MYFTGNQVVSLVAQLTNVCIDTIITESLSTIIVIGELVSVIAHVLCSYINNDFFYLDGIIVYINVFRIKLYMHISRLWVNESNES